MKSRTKLVSANDRPMNTFIRHKRQTRNNTRNKSNEKERKKLYNKTNMIAISLHHFGVLF